MGLDRDDEFGMDNRTEEVINEYLNNMDIDTEGIWEKIEAGLNKTETNSEGQKTDNGETNANQQDLADKKNRRRKITGYIWGAVGAAAVIVAAMIVLPFVTGVKNKKSEEFRYDDTEAAVCEDVVSEGATEETTGGGESVNGAKFQSGDMETENGANEETLTIQATEARDQTSVTDNAEAADVKLKILELKEDRVLCEVIDIEENEFGIQAEQEISVKLVGTDASFSEYEEGDILLGLLIQSDEADLYSFCLYDD
ncbi:MAG: hypothetical protein J6L77_04205 [Coprococcus sp.]|nr:hypothetical protein [Coprococcus sp.]